MTMFALGTSIQAVAAFAAMCSLFFDIGHDKCMGRMCCIHNSGTVRRPAFSVMYVDARNATTGPVLTLIPKVSRVDVKLIGTAIWWAEGREITLCGSAAITSQIGSERSGAAAKSLVPALVLRMIELLGTGCEVAQVI